MKGRWIKDKKIGEIFVEKILVECGFPLLFVAINLERNERFLTLCIEDDEEYLLALCDSDTLSNILDRKQDIRSAFENSKKLGKIVYESGAIYKPIESPKAIIDLLPEQGLLLETEIDLEAYIDKLRKENCSRESLNIGYVIYFDAESKPSYRGTEFLDNQDLSSSEHKNVIEEKLGYTGHFTYKKEERYIRHFTYKKEEMIKSA